MSHVACCVVGQMFEISVLFIISLAVGYGVALWRMGRADDVLHGHFIQATEPKPEISDRLNEMLNSLRRELSDAARR